MTQYSQLKSIFKKMYDAHAAGQSVSPLWQTFVEVARQPSEKSLGPLDGLKNSLDAVIGDRPKESLRILDHGCGGGLKILYVAAIGYTNIYGVNVNDNVDWLNDIIDEVFGYKDQRFHLTDGKRLPFPDNSFDMITSNQVLEHVSDNDIESYYAEEGRVLVNGGHAFHEVPHSFIPYDSHSRLWCAHWFPPVLRPFAYGLLKSIQQNKNLMKDGKHYTRKYCGEYVRNRSPIFHRKMLTKYIGSYKDLTKARLLAPQDWKDYDRDGSLSGRRLVDILVKLPILGGVFLAVFSNMVMLQTLSTKDQ